MTLPSLTDAEVHALAVRMIERSVFTSDQIARGDEQLLGSIFMVLAFSPDLITEARSENITMFWAPMSAAGPRAINGYPIFFEVNLVKFTDHERILAKFRELDAVLHPKASEP